MTQGREYSESTAARIDQEVQQLLISRQRVVRQLLGSARERLDRLAERLLQEETLGDADLTAILGPRPLPSPSEPPRPKMAPMPRAAP